MRRNPTYRTEYNDTINNVRAMYDPPRQEGESLQDYSNRSLKEGFDPIIIPRMQFFCFDSAND